MTGKNKKLTESPIYKILKDFLPISISLIALLIAIRSCARSEELAEMHIYPNIDLTHKIIPWEGIGIRYENNSLGPVRISSAKMFSIEFSKDTQDEIASKIRDLFKVIQFKKKKGVEVYFFDKGTMIAAKEVNYIIKINAEDLKDESLPTEQLSKILDKIDIELHIESLNGKIKRVIRFPN